MSTQPDSESSEETPIPPTDEDVSDASELTATQTDTSLLVNLLSAYASLVDPEEGTDLQFVHTHSINGVKCAKLELNDVQKEFEYWQKAVLCSVLGANPPYEAIKGFINRIWVGFEIDKS